MEAVRAKDGYFDFRQPYVLFLESGNADTIYFLFQAWFFLLNKGRTVALDPLAEVNPTVERGPKMSSILLTFPSFQLF